MPAWSSNIRIFIVNSKIALVFKTEILVTVSTPTFIMELWVGETHPQLDYLKFKQNKINVYVAYFLAIIEKVVHPTSNF